jgi:predicted RNA binding protein YcfA (HicA-like mRNA interferase family)
MGFTMTIEEIIAFLACKGFQKKTKRGRHGTKMVRGEQRIPIPTHKRDIPKGTIDAILKAAGFTANDVMKWRNG